jgi:hypothetical protein
VREGDKMNVEIKNRFTGEIIIVGEYENVCDAVLKNKDKNLYGANLSGADLSRADLSGADLSRADLSGANLSGANLPRADLSGAYLSGANLYGAKNIKLPIITIAGSVHSVWYMDGRIKIGCEDHTVDRWAKKYQTIGNQHNYTDEQISEYGQYIKMIKDYETK